MPNWKKIIVSGSDASLNSITASAGFFGTASWAQSASNALNAVNASSADLAKTVNTVENITSATFYPTFVDSNNTPGSVNELVYTSTRITFNPGQQVLTVRGISTNGITLTGSLNVTGSVSVVGAMTASIFSGSSFTGSLFGTASYVTGSVHNSANPALSASYALSSSFALSASWAPGGGTSFPYIGSAIITGSLIVSGSTGGINTVNGTLLTTTGTQSLNYSNDHRATSQTYYTSFKKFSTQEGLLQNHAYSGDIVVGNLDASVATYNPVYLETDGFWYPVANNTSGATKMLGVCVDNTLNYVLLEGDLAVSTNNTYGTYVVGATYGVPIYVSTTTSQFTTTVPTSDVIRIVGYIYYNSTGSPARWLMKFKPSADWYVQ